MTFFKVLLSLFTGIGGHYLNRRWDRAIFFFSLFVLYPVLVYALFYTRLTAGDYTEIEPLQQHFILIFCGGVAVIWLLSLLVTRRDAARQTGSPFSRWSFSGVIGAVVTSLLTGLYLLSSVLIFVNSFDLTGSLGEKPVINEHSDSRSDHFFNHLYFGGGSGVGHLNPQPPSGEGLLRGRILFKGQPAVGVQLTLDLNNEYRASDLETDADGYFSLPLEPGTWFINSIQTRRWPEKPQKGSFSLFYDRQPKLVGESFNPYARLGDSGYRVEVKEKSDQPQIEIRIGRDLNVTWPVQATEKNQASLDDVIRWDAYPEAENYYLIVNHLTREGDTTTYSPVTERLLRKTELPLADLAHAPADDTTEYSVQLYAFAADGTLISQSAGMRDNGTFVLDGGQRLVKDGTGFTPVSKEDADKYISRMRAVARNQTLIEAVDVLLTEQKLSEAEALLALVDSEHAEGKKELFQGYLYALRGECNKAEERISAALAIDPEVCISDQYLIDCQ